MTTIDKLSSIDSLSSGDLFPVFDVSNSDPRKVSYSVLKQDIIDAVEEPGASTDSDWVIIQDYDAADSGDITSELLTALADTTSPILLNGDYSITIDSSADASAILPKINQLFVSGSLVINIGDGEYSVTDYVDIYNPTAINIEINGVETPNTTISSVGAASGASGAWSVPITVASATNIELHDYVLINPASLAGTGRYKEIAGCFEVVDVTGSVVTINHTHTDSSFPTMTLSDGDVYPLKSILRWGAGGRGISIYGATLKQISSLVIGGPFDISSDSPADGADDGLQVGSAPNTSETGGTESHAIHNGGVYLYLVGVVEWPNNGIQVTGGDIRGFLVATCGNGWRGCQAAESGLIYAKFSAHVGNGASGVEAEGNGVCNVAGSVSAGNLDQGYFAIGGGVIVANSTSYSGGNNTYGYEAKNNGSINADTSIAESNGSGAINSESGLVFFGSSSTSANNGTAFTVSEGGIIVATGAGSITDATVYSFDEDSRGTIVQDDGEIFWPGTTKLLSASSRKGILWNVSSIGDLSLSFDSAGAGSFTNRLVFKTAGEFYPAGATSVGRSANHFGTIYVDDIVQAAAASGGTGSAGAGNQYVVLTINGTNYKLLHDGTV